LLREEDARLGSEGGRKWGSGLLGLRELRAGSLRHLGSLGPRFWSSQLSGAGFKFLGSRTQYENPSWPYQLPVVTQKKPKLSFPVLLGPCQPVSQSPLPDWGTQACRALSFPDPNSNPGGWECMAVYPHCGDRAPFFSKPRHSKRLDPDSFEE
jgi:hypothetical protein